MNTGLIHRVLSNTATKLERQELSDWISASEENREEFNNIKLLWSRTGPMEDQNSIVKDFSRIKSDIESKIRKRKRSQIVIAVLVFSILIIVTAIPAVILSRDRQLPVKYLHFKNASLGSVIQEIESKYDVAIEVEKQEILSCIFTGTFYQDQYGDVLQNLSAAMNLSVEMVNDRRFKLQGIGCGTERTTNP